MKEFIFSKVTCQKAYRIYRLPSNKITLMSRISELLHDKVYLFKSPEVATVLMRRQKVTSLFQSVNSNGHQNDIQVDQIAGKI